MGHRYNIGLVVAEIEDCFSENITRGAMDIAEKLDANLMIFPAGYIGRNSEGIENMYEYQYNTLLFYAADAKLDYVIVVTGSICFPVSDEVKLKLLQCFGNTPVLNVASVIEGYDYLVFDNRSGIVEAMEHLIVEQGRKHIAMMRGDMNNFEARERYEAYRNSLEKYGLDYDESYSTECDMSPYVTDEVIKLIENNPKIDAIVCVNDQVAQGVYKALESMGIDVGRDIAVVGFDDQPFAARMEPPMASIRADAYRMGQIAMEKAINYLGGVLDDRHMVETNFIPRYSSMGRNDGYEDTDVLFVGDNHTKAVNIADYMFGHRKEADIKDRIISILSELFGTMEDCLANKAMEIDDYYSLEKIIDHIFYSEIVEEKNIDAIQNIVDGGYRYFFGICRPENANYVQRIYNYFYRRINLDVAAGYRNLVDRTKERVHFDNIVLRDMLMMNGNIEDSCSFMLKRLHIIGADTTFLYLLDKPIEYRPQEMLPPNLVWNFMAYAYGNNVNVVPEHERRVMTPMIFANKHLNYGRRSTLIAVDLFCQNKQYGVILCEPHSEDFLNEVRFVSYQLSSAITTMYLLRTQENIQMELHSKNLSLDNMSKLDELTGVFNRRGFYAKAEEMIAESEDHRFVVAYGDMDNLKLVNDHYGHAEGDFSIKSLARCIGEILGPKAAVGRMGGDEFVAIAPYEPQMDVLDYINRKNEIMEILNAKAAKPYRIGMSVGFVICECHNSYDLKENIDKADGVLYDEKSRRIKKI